MMGPPPRNRNNVNDQYRVPLPKSIKEIPGYLKNVITSFLQRLFYIYALVWEASPFVLFVMMFMAVFNGVMPVIGALISKELINLLAKAYSKEITDFSVIITVLIMQFAYTFFKQIVQRIYNAITRISGSVVTNHIKLKIMRKSQEIDVSSYDSPDFYAKLENANREAGTRPIEILNSTFGIMSNIISMVSFITVLFAVSPMAPLIIVLMSVPSTIINFVYRRKNVNYMFRKSKDRRQMNYYSSTIVNKNFVKELRMLGLSDVFREKYEQVYDKYFKGLKKLIYEECFWNVGASVVTVVINCALYLFIAKGVFDGNYEVGNYSLYTGALSSIASGVASLITTTATIYEGTLFINNMIAFMNEKKTIVPVLDPPRKVSRHTGHTITFDNVSFAYPGTEKYVIKNVSFTIEAGETVAVVGLNGAGKTTLIKLLTRLYDPTEGTIYLDGNDIKEYDVEELYAMFGIIFQDFGKYAFTVKENIAFGDLRKGIVDEDIEKAAEESDSKDFIEKLTEKYDTPLMRYFEDNGIELSIGQWQKLSVARAFYSDSDVLILDEPTASLDPIAEQEIFNQFDELREDKTTIFVSHRLSSATIADKIIVLEYGEVIEMGNHAHLMHEKGKYYTLFSTQAKRYIAHMEETPSGSDGDSDHMKEHGVHRRIPEDGSAPGEMPMTFENEFLNKEHNIL